MVMLIGDRRRLILVCYMSFHFVATLKGKLLMMEYPNSLMSHDAQSNWAIYPTKQTGGKTIFLTRPLYTLSKNASNRVGQSTATEPRWVFRDSTRGQLFEFSSIQPSRKILTQEPRAIFMVSSALLPRAIYGCAPPFVRGHGCAAQEEIAHNTNMHVYIVYAPKTWHEE